MPVSKAQIKATAKYEAANYDKILVRLPKGKRSEIQARAKENGQSLNAFIVAAVAEKMERERQREKSAGDCESSQVNI